jgi:hypothetical protein
VVAPVEVSHLGAEGLVSQVSRVRSLQLVTTNMRTTARAAITASVFTARPFVHCMTQGRRTVPTMRTVRGIHHRPHNRGLHTYVPEHRFLGKFR